MGIRQETSKILIYHAFNKLIREKPLNKITVRDILETSGVSRSTFYRHFTDKYDLMNWFYQYHVEQLWRDGKYMPEILLNICNLYYENKDYFLRILDYNNQNSFRNFIYHKGTEFISNFIKIKLNKDELSEELKFAIKMFNYGAFEMIPEWLYGEIKMTPEEFNRQRCNNMPQILKDIILDPPVKT